MLRSSRPTRKPSQRPVSSTPLLSASIAARAALMRSTASSRSYSGFAASPVESSIDNPATPVLTARATLTPTFSASCAKPPSKSALTGRSTAAQSSVRCFSTSSSVTAIVGLADRPGKTRAGGGERLEAEMLQRLGAAGIERDWECTKHPLSCNLRNVARLSAGSDRHDFSPLFAALISARAKIAMRGIARQRGCRLCDDLSQERSLFRQDEFVFLGEIEIGHAFAVVRAAARDSFHRLRGFRRKSARTRCCWCLHAASSSPADRRRISE